MSMQKRSRAHGHNQADRDGNRGLSGVSTSLPNQGDHGRNRKSEDSLHQSKRRSSSRDMCLHKAKEVNSDETNTENSKSEKEVGAQGEDLENTSTCEEDATDVYDYNDSFIDDASPD